jgi:hypothetical protein
MGLDTKIYWLTDRLSQCDFDRRQTTDEGQKSDEVQKWEKSSEVRSEVKDFINEPWENTERVWTVVTECKCVVTSNKPNDPALYLVQGELCAHLLYCPNETETALFRSELNGVKTGTTGFNGAWPSGDAILQWTLPHCSNVRTRNVRGQEERDVASSSTLYVHSFSLPGHYLSALNLQAKYILRPGVCT